MVLRAALLSLSLLSLASALVVNQQPLAAPTSHVARERYDGQQVYRLNFTSVDASLREEVRRAIDLLDLDVWRSTHSSIDVRASPSSIASLERFLPGSTDMHVWISDLQSLVDAATPPLHQPPLVDDDDVGILGFPMDSLDTPFHDAYHSLEELYAFADQMAVRFDGDGIKVESFSVGQSFEGREIRGWKASMDSQVFGRGQDEDQDEDPEEEQLVREFVIQSGQHAREWVGPATALYFIHSLLLSAEQDPTGPEAVLLKSFTFTIVPTINPDGYAYSHEKSRMWRKNRQEVGSRSCAGIDLNSNWGYKWRAPRSTTPCSDSYPGDHAFEAVETRAMADYLANGSTGTTTERKVRAFIDLHSYGQLFMFPYAHSCADIPADAEMLMEAGLGVIKSIRTVHGETYQSGQACDLTFRAPGDAIDFTYGVTDIRWSYSAELRDTGTYGFLLPPSLIRPAAEETTAGLMYLARFIYNAEIAG
ncbi:putative metallocarboxypeptidase ecm14 [Saitozyma podzolica]|uniref:Inactive metallocarboxypeptidase ECM14 n=1 Tax=Saitozyma podzolica TaxID=1890683 RepID=A0A427YQN4_9TREE|nr:putative metallocarboxypeptidase ecm14 [Saitozyma podzolica]